MLYNSSSLLRTPNITVLQYGYARSTILTYTHILSISVTAATATTLSGGRL